jgi:hypothetical protein
MPYPIASTGGEAENLPRALRLRDLVDYWFARLRHSVRHDLFSRRGLLWLMSIGMMVYPFVVWVREYRSGVILISVPLIVTFVGGWIGFNLARPDAAPKNLHSETRASL